MSRGSKVFYIESRLSLPPISSSDGTDTLAQELDLAVVRNHEITDQINSSAGVQTDALHKTHHIYQLVRDSSAPYALGWSELDVLNDSHKLIFTDNQIIPNVTKSRKAHIEEIRNFINFIHSTYASRYGSSYYHAHDFTNAQLIWSRDTDRAKIEFKDYGVDKKWLTLFFGDNGAVGDFAGSDRTRIASLDVSNNIKNIVDFMAWCAVYYVDCYLEENLTVKKNALINLNLTVDGDTLVKGATTLTRLVKMLAALQVIGTSDFSDNAVFRKDVECKNRLTTEYLTVNTDATFNFDLHVTGTIHTSYLKANEIESTAISTETINVSKNASVELSLTVGRDLTVSNLIKTMSLEAANYVAAYDIRLMGPVLKYKDKAMIVVSSDGETMLLGAGSFTEVSGLSDVFTWNGSDVYTRAYDGHTRDGSGINADMVDDHHVSNKSGDIPFSNGGRCEDLNADMLDGFHLSDIRNLIPQPGHGNGFDADSVDGLHGTFILERIERVDDKVTDHMLTTCDDIQSVHGIKAGHGGAFSADMLDGYHLENILDKIPEVSTTGTKYLDSGGDNVGTAMFMSYRGLTFYFPTNNAPAGTCHTNCFGAGRHCMKG